jgi:multiple sugar transport system permease protein
VTVSPGALQASLDGSVGASQAGAQWKGRSAWARYAPGYLLMTIVALPFLLPVYWFVIGLFKPPAELVHVPPLWFPEHWVLSNFRGLFATQGSSLVTYSENTLYISGFTVVATLVSSALAAYGFSQYRFRGRDALFWTVILTLILPSWATIIPQFQLFTWLHWVGTLNPLTIPNLTGDPFTIFLMRQYMLTIPHDYAEAARVDGAGELRIFWNVMVPMIRPVLAVAAVFAFIYSYNNFFGPLVYLTNPSNYTLSLGAYQFVEVHGTPDIAEIVAYTALVVAPLVLVFVLAQRQIIRGVRLTGMR